jgi:hypothetical protein
VPLASRLVAEIGEPRSVIRDGYDLRDPEQAAATLAGSTLPACDSGS